MVNIAILGSTGSIGRQTLDIIRENREEYNVISITANSNITLFEQQIKEFEPEIAVIMEETKYKDLSAKVTKNTEIMTGNDGLICAVTLDKIDVVISSIVGIAGLIPTFHAVKCGKKIALANKETLVAGGSLIMDLAKKNNSSIIPVDSEHSAIFQCIGNNNPKNISKLILTASGGPFRNKTEDELLKVTLEDALKHPNWSMGNKISIDSATMMNKGLEVIEAKWLFDIELENIEVCIHPQSIIHSMVEFVDGAVMAQMGLPDMKIPIQYALTYPDRMYIKGDRLNIIKAKSLDFFEPDTKKFPCLKLAYEALKAGDSACVVLNGANEEAVKLFMDKKISFRDISYLIQKVLNSNDFKQTNSLEDIIELDKWAKIRIREIYKERCYIC